MPSLWRFRAALDRVIDGDSFWLKVDPPFNTSTRREVMTLDLRLYGVNCPEKNRAETRVAGLAAMTFTADWFAIHAAHWDARLADPDAELTADWPLLLLPNKPRKNDRYDRYLATVLCGAGHSLGPDLLAAGHAVEYFG